VAEGDEGPAGGGEADAGGGGQHERVGGGVGLREPPGAVGDVERAARLLVLDFEEAVAPDVRLVVRLPVQLALALELGALPAVGGQGAPEGGVAEAE